MSDAQLFERQINDLYNALDRDDLAGSADLLRQIGEAGNTMAAEPLSILLREFPDEQIRHSAAIALGQLGPEAAVAPLIAALGDTSALIQEDAAYALGKIGDSRAVRPLRDLQSDNPRVRKAVASALAQIEGKNKKEGLFNRPGSSSGSNRYSRPMPPQAADGGKPASTVPAKPQAKPAVTSAVAKPQVKPAATSVVVKPQVVKEQKSAPLKIVKKEDMENVDKNLNLTNPLLAAVASFLVPGLGQLYNGEKLTKALLYLAGFIVGLAVFILPGIIIWIYCIYNAYATSRKINAGSIPYKKPDTVTLVAYGVIGLIVRIVGAALALLVLLIALALVAAFVFPINGGSSNMPAPLQYPAVSMSRVNTSTIMVTDIGGGDAATLTGFLVMVNGTEISPISGHLTAAAGSSANYTVPVGREVDVYVEYGGQKQFVVGEPI